MKKTIISGKLQINENEGGFAPDDFTIDGIPFADFIGKHLGLESNCRGSYSDNYNLPKVRITIETEK